MLARTLAYCLEWQDGIELTDGIAAVDEPAVLVKDLTGRITAWIEVGAPTPERLHKGSKQAARCAVYAHRDPTPWLAQLAGAKVHRAAGLPVRGGTCIWMSIARGLTRPSPSTGWGNTLAAK